MEHYNMTTSETLNNSRFYISSFAKTLLENMNTIKLKLEYNILY